MTPNGSCLKGTTLLRATWQRFAGDRRGNLALYGALAMLPMLAGVAVVTEYTDGTRERAQLQNLLDAAVLAGASASKDQAKTAEAHFAATVEGNPESAKYPLAAFTLGDGRLIGTATVEAGLGLGSALLGGNFTVGARS